MTKRKTPLPDRWDFDKWRNGKALNPPRGYKVGIYWGDLLHLEYILRQTAKTLESVSRDMTFMREALAEPAETFPQICDLFVIVTAKKSMPKRHISAFYINVEIGLPLINLVIFVCCLDKAAALVKATIWNKSNSILASNF